MAGGPLRETEYLPCRVAISEVWKGKDWVKRLTGETGMLRMVRGVVAKIIV